MGEQVIHKVKTVAQIALFAPEFRKGIAKILHDTRVTTQSVDDVYKQLEEHVEFECGLWVVLEDGRLIAWLAAKCFIDNDRKTACITWAYSTPRSKSNDLVMAACEEWARSINCKAIYCARRLTRLRAFYRLMQHYGYEFEGIIMCKDFRPTEPAEETPRLTNGAAHG